MLVLVEDFTALQQVYGMFGNTRANSNNQSNWRCDTEHSQQNRLLADDDDDGEEAMIIAISAYRYFVKEMVKDSFTCVHLCHPAQNHFFASYLLGS